VENTARPNSASKELAEGELKVPLAKLDDHDTEGILALCEQARRAVRPERDPLIALLYSLNLDRCRTRALEAVEGLTYDLVVNDAD